MDNSQKLQEAFLRGFEKKAEEHGLTKEAFLPLALRLGAGIGGQLGLFSLLGRAAASKRLLGAAPMISNAAKSLHGLASAPAFGAGFKPMLAQTGISMVGGAIGDKLINPIASRFEPQ